VDSAGLNSGRQINDPAANTQIGPSVGDSLRNLAKCSRRASSDILMTLVGGEFTANLSKINDHLSIVNTKVYNIPRHQKNSGLLLHSCYIIWKRF
jgi:hypothetical protein